MSSRFRGLVVAGVAGLALGGLTGHYGLSSAAAARKAEERTMMRCEIVEASLSGRPPLDYFLFVPSSASSDSFAISSSIVLNVALAGATSATESPAVKRRGLMNGNRCV